MTDEPRSVAAILADIRDVERYLGEAPPHAASGIREDLQERLRRLQRELAAARRTS